MPAKSELYSEILDNISDGVYFVDHERRITYWNKSAERITGFDSSEVVGKRCSDNILMHVDDEGTNLCGGLCPLAKSISEGAKCKKEIYLNHKNGHRLSIFVNVYPIKDSNGKITGAIEIFNETKLKNINEQIEELKSLALLDPLTGIGNRRHAEINLQSRLDELQRYDWPFGVLFIDIDRFKDVNDTYGHDIGDKILKMVAKTLQNSLRSFDFLGRWGGEEFVAIVMNIDKELLLSIADKCRILVEKSILHTEQDDIKVTVSIGATMAQIEDSIDILIKRADKLMYQCKVSGRNRVLVAQEK